MPDCGIRIGFAFLFLTSIGCTFDVDTSGFTYPDVPNPDSLQDFADETDTTTPNDGAKQLSDAQTSDSVEPLNPDTSPCDSNCDTATHRCSVHETQCNKTDPSLIETCDESGQWMLSPCPLGFLCLGGACIRPACLPNSFQCDPAVPNVVLSCDANGKWQLDHPCPAGSFCSDGSCVPPADPCKDTPGVCLDSQWFPCGSANPDDSLACMLSPCTVQGCAPIEAACTAPIDQNICMTGDQRGIYRCTQDQQYVQKIADCPPFFACVDGDCVWPVCTPDQPNACVADGQRFGCAQNGLGLSQTQCPDDQICIPTQSATCLSPCITTPNEKFCSGSLAVACPTKPGTIDITQCKDALSCDVGDCKPLLLYEHTSSGNKGGRDIYATRLTNPEKPWLVAGLPDVDESQPVFVPALSLFAYFFDDMTDNSQRKIAFRPLSDLAGSNTPKEPRFLSLLPLPEQQRYSISTDGLWLALGAPIPFVGPRIGIRPLMGGQPSSLTTKVYSDHTAPRFHRNGSLTLLAPSTTGTFVVRIDPNDPTATPEVLTQVPYSVDAIWSPDEQWLAYVTGPTVQKETQIWLYSLTDLVHYPVSGMDEAKDPVFSAEGAWLYFAGKAADGGKDFDLFRVSLPPEPQNPQWAPEIVLKLPGHQTSPEILVPAITK